jgi:cobalamin biosynthesis Mg chelatase CobN
MKILRTTFLFIALLIGLTYCALSFSGCGFIKTKILKTKSKTEVKKEETKTETKDSTQIKKEEAKITETQKNDITEENTTTEQEITYTKDKDENGKQLIASVINRQRKESKTDRSTFTKEQIRSIIDSLKTIYKTDYKLKLDSIGESQNKNKDIDKDTSVAANIPWYVWIIVIFAIFLLFVFYFGKPKRSIGLPRFENPPPPPPKKESKYIK